MLTLDDSCQENRKIKRFSTQFPMKLEIWIDAEKSWTEIIHSKDISVFGAGFVLSRPVRRGRLIHLTIPMPRKLRNYDFAEPQYKIWGIVRRCIKINEGVSGAEKYAIGAGFIGKSPPDSFWKKPSTIYDISDRDGKDFWIIREADLRQDESELPADVRRHSRLKLPTNITIEMLGENGEASDSEPTVTENISVSGAAVYSTLSPPVGSFVRVKSEQYNVSIISIVRGFRVGADNIKRLHLEFIDRFFPLEGIV